MKCIRNAAQCRNCLDVIESKHQHDFVTCSCFKNDELNRGIAIDGGRSGYIRRIGQPENFKDLSEWGDK